MQRSQGVLLLLIVLLSSLGVSISPSSPPPRRCFLCLSLCQRKRAKSHNVQLSEGNEKERGGIASAESSPLLESKRSVCHQTFGILSGSSDKFHQGRPAMSCNLPLQALSASSLFLHLVELNTCEVRPGPLLVQKARVSPGPSETVIRGSGKLEEPWGSLIEAAEA